MARLQRLSMTDLPHHVVWLGHNGGRVFEDDADRVAFFDLLAEHARQHQVWLHAYVLLDTEVHLLVTPRQDGALPRFMQAVGRSYVRRFNLRHGRRGSLWEGRFRCTVIEPGDRELDAMVLLDTEPVHRGECDAPLLYPWSSHAHYLGQRHDAALVAPPAYWALGNTPFSREAAYASRVTQGLGADQRRVLMDAAMKGWAVGSESFLARLESLTQRRVSKASPGRPRRQGF